MQSVETAYGPCKFWGKDEYIGRSLYNYHEFSGDEVEMILSLAKEGNGYCLDIGANIGFISMALLANGLPTCSFEPQPEVYNVLRDNIAALGGKAMNVGLADKPGTGKMPRIRYGDRGNYGGLSIGTRSELGTIDVTLYTLDSLRFPRLGFVKIDVEGFEELVLKGGCETILHDKPIMYIEDDRKEKSAKLRQYIKLLGYSIEEHFPPLYRENNRAGLKKNIWDRNYVSHNIICRPC